MREGKKNRNDTPRTSVFSTELHTWLKHGQDKSLAGLNRLFAEKTFAIAFILLMALPALPLPTGGITHVTEIITMLLCLELIVGRSSIWLPKKWLDKDVSKPLSGKAAERLIAFISWFERWSRRRWSSGLTRKPVLSVIGLIMLLYTIAAFVAPPFSGLDTLPAVGVVVMSLALVLEDGVILLAGVIIGAAGVGLEVTAGTALYDGLKHVFHHG